MKILYRVIGFGLNLATLVAPKWAAKAAINLFSTPPKPNLREKDRRFLESARCISANHNGYTITEYHWGDEQAPLALLSYGWGYNAGRWRYFVGELLSAGYRVIAYDPNGHGQSPKGHLNIPINAGFIVSLINTYGPAEIIIGHSFGGASAVCAIDQLPRRQHPKRVVVMASFSSAPTIFRNYSHTMGFWRRTRTALVSTFEQRIGRSLNDFDLAEMTARFGHIQGLLVHHPTDRVTPFSNAIRYHSHWPGSYLFKPEEGGHHLGTKDITQAILRFAIEGEAPAEAEKQERPVDVKHELAMYFAGV